MPATPAKAKALKEPAPLSIVGLTAGDEAVGDPESPAEVVVGRVKEEVW